MYPLNMQKILEDGLGFAVANDEAEHVTLSEIGYEPKHDGVTASSGQTKDELQAKAKELGVEVDSRWGVKRLQEEIAKANQGS